MKIGTFDVNAYERKVNDLEDRMDEVERRINEVAHWMPPITHCNTDQNNPNDAFTEKMTAVSVSEPHTPTQEELEDLFRVEEDEGEPWPRATESKKQASFIGSSPLTNDSPFHRRYTQAISNLEAGKPGC